MLVEAAARRWKVAATALRTEDGQVIDDAGNRRALQLDPDRPPDYLDFLEARKELLAAAANQFLEELLHGDTSWMADGSIAPSFERSTRQTGR